MKNSINLLIEFFKRKLSQYAFFKKLFRKKEFQARQDTYDDVINKLAPVLSQKENHQEILKKEIITYMRDFLGYDYDSKFIPKKFKNKAEIRLEVDIKFKFKMKKLDMSLNDELQLICI